TATGNGSASWTAYSQVLPGQGLPGGYTTTGSGPIDTIGPGVPIPYGSFASFGFKDNSDSGLLMGLTINGVPWHCCLGSVTGGFALAQLAVGILSPITHAGTYLADFGLGPSFNGQPAPVSGFCSASTPCTEWQFIGGGTGLIYVSDFPGRPNTFYVTGGN